MTKAEQVELVATLSVREREVVFLRAVYAGKGMRVNEAANRMELNCRTVSTYGMSIMTKLQTDSFVQIAYLRAEFQEQFDKLLKTADLQKQYPEPQTDSLKTSA